MANEISTGEPIIFDGDRLQETSGINKLFADGVFVVGGSIIGAVGSSTLGAVGSSTLGPVGTGISGVTGFFPGVFITGLPHVSLL